MEVLCRLSYSGGTVSLARCASRCPRGGSGFIADATGDVAVRRGPAATGDTITAAAAIMIVVFGSFIPGGQRIIKE